MNRPHGYMRCYASYTGTSRNLQEMKKHGWRLLISPAKMRLPEGFRYGLDNGAWSAYQAGISFDADAFRKLIERFAAGADWIVIPDIVAGGQQSLDFSEQWIPELHSLGALLLLAVQDGIEAHNVTALFRRYPKVNFGLFLGGSTEWKLRTMYGWGMVADALGCYYHVGRVNSIRRIRRAHEAGAHSIDGSSGSRFSVNIPMLNSAAMQPSLLTPERTR